MDDRTPIPDVSEGTFKETVLESRCPVLVQFRAEWSGPCHIAAPVLEALAPDYADRLAFYSLDVDASPTIAAEYGIRDLPTFLFFRGGRVVDHLVGAVAREDLSGRLDALVQGSGLRSST